MSIKDSNTEENIKNTAKQIFFAEGRFHATPQDIAEAAGVTRTLLNYYFRSKEVLFNLVLQQAHRDFEKKIFSIFDLDLAFKYKIEHFVEAFLEEHHAYPHLDTFLVTQMNEHAEKLDEIFGDNNERHQKVKKLLAEIETEIKKGTIQKTEPIQFLINLMSLLAHPAPMRPLLKKMMNISDKEFARLLNDRKEVIMNLLFRE